MFVESKDDVSAFAGIDTSAFFEGDINANINTNTSTNKALK